MTSSANLLQVKMNLIALCVITLVISYSKATVTSTSPAPTEHGTLYESIADLKNDVQSIIQQQRDTLNILTAVLQRQDDTQRQLTQLRQQQENTQRQLTQFRQNDDDNRRQLTPLIHQHNDFQNHINTFETLLHQHQGQIDQHQQILNNITETVSTKEFQSSRQSTIFHQQIQDEFNAQILQQNSGENNLSTDYLELKQALSSVVDRTAALQSLIIRLVGGHTYNEGRVEVFRPKVGWGAMCDANWNDNDAKVVCRQLGFPSENAEAKPKGYFGFAENPTHLSSVDCNGHEGSLWSCDRSQREENCNHYSVGVVCHLIRLVNGSNTNEGRVELWHGGQWGTVCDEDWDHNDAKVVCRELGLPYENAVAIKGGVFGRGTGKSLLNNVSCTGSEKNLFLCGYKEPEMEMCEHASVICQPPLRLVDGKNNREGRVEVWYNNEWGNVCIDYFSESDAMVVCRQLHLPTEEVLVIDSAYFGESTGQTWLKNLACSGTEENIWSCGHNGYHHYSQCGSNRHAAVVCRDIRLVNGSTAYDGRVEVWHNGQWGTICDRDWDIDDAKVVCRQLEMSYENALAKTGAYFGEGTGPIWLDNVNCTGSEQNVTACGHSEMDVVDCGHNRDAGVICESPIRLVNGSGSHEGRLEVWHNGQWGTVCDTHFERKEGKTVCRELGFPYQNSVVKTDAYFGKGTGQIWMDELDCQGYRYSFLSCKRGEWGDVSCDHSDDVSVACELPIRLENGRNIYEGRVEVWHNYYWGTVCDAGWDYNNAKVACRQLGLSYGNAEVKTGAYFGEGYGQVLLDDVNCTGAEEKLWLCDHRGWGMGNCNHSFDVGVVCKPPIRLVDGNSKYEGRVEVWDDVHQWGPVCSDNWNDAAAKVVCRELGLAYENVRSETEVYSGRGFKQAWFDLIECTGNEEQLMSCINGGWITGTCSHDAASVVCQTPVRLVNHPSQLTYVEVHYNGEWGVVCGDGWDNVDAKVVCRQLGLPYENAKKDFGNTWDLLFTYIWMNNVECKGSEEDLLSCPNTGSISYCRQIAGVLCQ